MDPKSLGTFLNGICATSGKLNISSRPEVVSQKYLKVMSKYSTRENALINFIILKCKQWQTQPHNGWMGSWNRRDFWVCMCVCVLHAGIGPHSGWFLCRDDEVAAVFGEVSRKFQIWHQVQNVVWAL